MSASNNKASSLKWAIEELSKQRDDLDAKLKVAHKRDETNALIDEVFAQKKALELRISALEDGLRVSTELVETTSSELESEMSKIDEKLDIAKERLQAIEQEEYLEELGKKLNRTHEESSETASVDSSQLSEKMDESMLNELGVTPQNVGSVGPSKSMYTSTEHSPAQSPLSASTITTSSPPMKASSNRIQNREAETQQPISSVISSQLPEHSSNTKISLEQTAQSLGIEPDFLAEKGLQAILRMIARNGTKLRFPLEVDQID